MSDIFSTSYIEPPPHPFQNPGPALVYLHVSGLLLQVDNVRDVLRALLLQVTYHTLQLYRALLRCKMQSRNQVKTVVVYGLGEFQHLGFSVASSFVISKLWTKIWLPSWL